MKMNVSGQGACSNTKRFELELARKISVRWLGHGTSGGDRESENFSSSGVFVGTRIEE